MAFIKRKYLMSLAKNHFCFFYIEPIRNDQCWDLLWLPCLSHLTPRNCGCSPGALDSLSIFSESMWAMEMTVAATYHGKPIKEQAAISMPTHSRSRWYPQPFCNKQIGNVRKSMEMKRTGVIRHLLTAWIPLTYFPCGLQWQHWSADPWRWG